MKKIKFLLFLWLGINLNSYSQNIPQGINYQAVVRDANGNAKINQQVPLQFTIYQSSPTGTMIYKEQQVVMTNSMGQCAHVIGSGDPVIPFNGTSFSMIDWGADSTFLKVELNSNTSFTGTFTSMGPTTKFQSVPYALYSQKTNLRAPTVQKFTSGSGTYTPPVGVLYIKVKMVGGGGGGGELTSTTGGTGGTTSFGTTLLVCTGGTGGTTGTAAAGSGGIGGTATYTAGPIILSALNGGSGGGSSNPGTSVNQPSGGMGASSPFGGAGGGGRGNGSQAGQNAIPNTGSGGGGQGNSTNPNNSGGGGGGAGAYIEAIISNPQSNYSYSVGTGATIGSGDGASGVIIIEEYYQ